MFKGVAGVELQAPSPRMTYQEAMERWVQGQRGAGGCYGNQLDDVMEGLKALPLQSLVTPLTCTCP